MRMPFAAAWLALLVAGCPARDVTQLDPHPQPQSRTRVTITQNRDLDLLFVVDNSKSMEDEQAELTAKFQAFMTQLRGIRGGLPNVHIGVVSSDAGALGTSICGPGDDGRLRHEDVNHTGCTLPGGAFISDVDDGHGGRTINYPSGHLEDTFACIASLGTKGCGLEQHLESVRRALAPGKNPGFIRDDAYLGIVFIADEDDCSTKDSEFYTDDTDHDADLGPLHSSFRCFRQGVQCDQPITNALDKSYTGCGPWDESPYLTAPDDFLDEIIALKGGNRRKVFMAGILGPETPVSSIDSDNGVALRHSCGDPHFDADGAAPAVRIAHLIHQLDPDRASLTPICADDFAPALEQIGRALTAIFGNPCLHGALDTTDISTAPGLQLECNVTLFTDPGAPDESHAVVPRCAMTSDTQPAAGGARPCYWVAPATADDDCDPADSGLVLHMEYAAGQAEPDEAELVADCAAP